jgi:hypothetical protein
MSIFDSSYLDPPKLLGSPRSGMNYKVEEEANRILAVGREGITSLEGKRDYLTDDQLALRASKEILNSQGVPDASICSGLFRRAHNEFAGKRPRSFHHHQEE